MRRLIVFLFVFASAISFSQDEDAWRDTLLMARKSYEKKEYNKALEYYESAQKIAPDDIDLSDEMAQSAYRSRDFERAEKIYRQGSSTKMSKSARGDAMHNLGNAQMKQENYEGAIESYKEALRNNPNDKETRYNLSKAIRKVKEQRTPPPPKPNNQNSQDQNQSDQGDQGQKGQQGDPKDGQGQNKSSQGNESNGQKKPNNSGSGGGSGGSSEGKLSNQMVERMLDELSKKEGETKRKMTGAGSGGSSAKSGKDW
ncbi:MAG: tetratricopeptide repeat protein [Flavobacteriales bacterium]|nr:tetratricopeptide repeat protein [Flavobacteriales bacterium]